MEEVNKIIRELWIKIYKGGGTEEMNHRLYTYNNVIQLMWVHAMLTDSLLKQFHEIIGALLQVSELENFSTGRNVLI